MDLVTYLVKPRDVLQCDSARACFDALETLDADFPRTIDRAAAGGASVDRVGYAFLAGYRAALSALDPLLGRASLCATEEGGAHPAQIATRLEAGTLTGTKTFATLASVAETLLVIASEGRGPEGRSRLRAVRIPARRDGVTIRDRPPLAFAPEIPHAEVVLANVRVEPAEVAPGDAYEKVLKPFRTLEDAHVTAALLGHIARHTADRSLVEQALAVLPALAAVSERSASSPEAHVILAGALAHARAIALSADAALYKPLLDVAANVRSRRTEAAWAKLLPT
jgi:acyl-CoA dehydrogenase